MTGSQLPQDEIELRLATTVAPMLIAVGTFSLTLMANRPNPEKTYADEVFMGLGLLSITAAAFLVDFIFDHLQQDWPKRLFVMNGGYLFFSLVMGFMISGTLFLYYSQTRPRLEWPPCVPFAFVGLFTVCKLLTHDDRQVWTAMMLGAVGFSLYVLWL